MSTNHIPNLTWVFDQDLGHFTMDVSYGFDYAGQPGSGVAWTKTLHAQHRNYHWELSLETRKAHGYPQVDVAPLGHQQAVYEVLSASTDLTELLTFGLSEARSVQRSIDEVV